MCNKKGAKNIMKKYKNYTVQGKVFTVKFEKYQDSLFGDMIDISIYEEHSPATSFSKKLVQFFTLNCFRKYTFIPIFSSSTINDSVIQEIELLISEWQDEKNFKQEWENL